MIKSLYVRVVLTYIIAVVIGLAATFYLASIMMSTVGDRFAERLQNELLKDAESIGAIFRSDGILNAEAELRETKIAGKYDVLLYGSSGKLVRENGGKASNLYLVPDQIVRSVLNGETYRGLDVSPTELVVGFPYEEEGESYALFIQVSEQKVVSFALSLLIFVFAINLIIGAMIILVAARYIVKPLLGMKVAAERMAKGEFDIELKWAKRKDELGRLAQSINGMASQLGQLEAMRQDFVSNVSHEIQSPLTSISGFSEALRQSDLTAEERNRYLTIIRNESERLSRLSDNLLKLAALDSRNHPFEPRIFDLDEQLRKAVVASEPQWAAKSIEWSLRLPKTKIEADEDQMNQVWVNLIGNAVKFTPEGGKISLSLDKNTEHVEVVVSDTGIGIPIAERNKVFERFYKADRSHNKKKPGSGLGLAIVKKIVSMHRGDVVLKGNPDGGTTAVVTLPHRIE